MRNLATILPLNSKLSAKFRRFNAIDRSIKVMKNTIAMKNCKTFCKAQTESSLQGIIEPPPIPLPPDKTLLSLWNQQCS